MSARAPFTPSRQPTGTTGPDRPLNLSGLKRPVSSVVPTATPSKPGTGGHARQAGLAQMKRFPVSPIPFKQLLSSQAQAHAASSPNQSMMPPTQPMRELHAPRATAPQMSSPRLDDEDSGYMSNMSGYNAQEDDGDESDALFRFGAMGSPPTEAPTQVIDLEANSPPPAPVSKRPAAPTETNDFAAHATKRQRPNASPSYFGGRVQAQHVQERPSTGQPHPSSRTMLPIPVQARPHSSQSQRPASQQSQHSQPRASQQPQHVAQRQPTPVPDPTGGLFRRINMPLAPEQASHLAAVWEKEHARWSKGSIEDWEQGGDELKERFNGLIERVVTNMTRKTSLFSDLHSRLASHRSALDTRGRELAEARQALVHESRSIAGGGGGGGGGASSSSGGGASTTGSSLSGSGGTGGSALSGSGSGGRSGSSPALGGSEGSDD
ncbi:unnamed protein product [Peniophora sp. CBMAI 1063]|nr:unnamed protein product [Peniophora sp. CBMAI 1063]